MNIQQKIGSRIKMLRSEKGISQEQLSDLCGLDQSYISSVENGKRNISIINIEKITLSLKISIEEFFNDTLFR
jgi:transcriptional regulator with XRE-family HTH domain